MAKVQAIARRTAIPKAIVAICLAILLIGAGLVAGLRYGVLLPQARVLIEARADGLKIGRFGRLKIEGLAGDIWRDFTIRRLTIRDEKGVWLEARNIHMVWRYGELLKRRFHAEAIDAQSVQVIRRPTLTPKGKSRGMPVSFHIDRARARVEMLPAFSYRRGLYDLDLALAVERRGGQRGKLHAASLLHAGDHLDLDFDLGKGRPIRVTADAEEARGGALAGALGLPADAPFDLKIAAAEGRFNAAAVSGTLQPLTASGGWNAQGGQAAGRVSLTASTLTRSLAQRLGPEARFSITGKKADAKLFALQGEVVTQNLVLRANGLGDPASRATGPQGLRVAADTPALSKIIGGPQTGAARVSGVVTTRKDGWRFVGAAAVSDVGFAGYRLARISGPLTAAQDPKALAISARIDGAGGQGAGWAAALLGASPRAALDASRLADGRLLLKQVDVIGKGLTVNASGGRSLLGGLTFKGKAEMSNLAAARPGAAGGLSATFNAAQGGPDRPWTLSVDARGKALATGYAELDRLLGAEPKLALQGNLDRGRIAVGKAELNGAALRANGGGVLAADRMANFKIDWSAEGPFRAGPVEVTGSAKGTGALTGKLDAPRLDLIADVSAIDVPRLPLTNAHLTVTFLRRPDGSSGSAAVTASSAYGPARAKGDFRFPEGGVDLSDLSVDAGGLKADGALSLRRRAPSAANLDLAVGPGAFLDAGQVTGKVLIADGAGGARANLSLTAQNARPKNSSLLLHNVRLTADGPMARLPYEVRGDGVSHAGRWRANGSGELSQQQVGYQLTYNGAGRLGSRDLRTAEPAIFRFGGPDRSARLRLVSGDGGRLDLDGKLQGDTAQVRAEAAGLGLGLLDEDLDGKFDAVLTASGAGGRLDGVLDAKLTSARGKGSPVASGIDGALKGRLADNTLILDTTVANSQGLKAQFAVTLPTEASAAPFRIAIARQRPMRGTFNANGEVRPLWDLLVGGERSLSGQVRAQGTLAGTLADPQATGQLAVSDGRFDDGPTGLSLRQLNLTANLGRGGVDLTEARAVDAQGGSVSGSGRLSLARAGASNLQLNLTNFRLIDNEQAKASATGPVTLARTADGKVRIGGNLRIDRADVSPVLPAPSGVVLMDVVEKNRPAELTVLEPAPARSANGGWTLDVTLKAPGKIFLRGRGLDVELSLDSHVGGTTSRPDLSGVARVVRGDYEFAGKRFEFDDTGVVHLSTRPQAIRLDLSATREDPSLTAVVRIRGTAAKPDITLTSTPTLPNDEVLSQVLFGRSASQLSAFEAAQLASALSAMAGGGGLDVIGNLRSLARLDRLAIGGGGNEDAGMTVSGGKYLTDDVYLELTGGGREGPSATVEWRIRRTLSLLSRIGDQSGGKLAVRWKRDY